MNSHQLGNVVKEAEAAHRAACASPLALDLTRGKPAASQLDAANALDGILGGQFLDQDGNDTRNYGGPWAFPSFGPSAAQCLMRRRTR